MTERIQSYECNDDSGGFIISTGYNPNGSKNNVNLPEIVNTIRELPLDLEIISKAIEIYHDTISRKNSESLDLFGFPNRIKSVKGSRKTRLVFYCVYMAYYELGMAVDPYHAADLVKLSKDDIDKALEEYCPSGVNSVEPMDLVPFYIERLNLANKNKGFVYNEKEITQGVKKVIQECQSTEIGREGLQNMASRTVAIVSLYFFLNDIRNYNLQENISEFEEACYLSWACIKRYLSKIESYYNGGCKSLTAKS